MDVDGAKSQGDTDKVQIPYFTKAILSNRNLLNINLKAIALGDPTIGNNAAMTDVVTSTYLHQIASLYKIPTNILHAFDSADHECGFDRVVSQLTYPPIGPITIPGNPEGLNFLKHFHKRKQEKREDTCFPTGPNTPSLTNASINDPCTIACATYTTAFAYLDSIKKCFDPYNTHATCNDTKDTSSSTHYFNREDVKRAVHVPLEKDYMECNNTVFERLSQEYVVPPAYGILPEILEKGIPVHIYSGDRDFLLNHWGTELVVGNMSWYGSSFLCLLEKNFFFFFWESPSSWEENYLLMGYRKCENRNGHQGFSCPPNRTFVLSGSVVANWQSEVSLFPPFPFPFPFPFKPPIFPLDP